MNHFSRASIVTPTALYVQICEAENQPLKKQVWIKRGEIAPAAPSAPRCAHWAGTQSAAKRGAPFVFPPCAGANGDRCYARSN